MRTKQERADNFYVPRYDGIAGEMIAQGETRRRPHFRSTPREMECVAEEWYFQQALDDPPVLHGEERRIVEQLSRLTTRHGR